MSTNCNICKYTLKILPSNHFKLAWTSDISFRRGLAMNSFTRNTCSFLFDTVFDALEWRELTEILDFYLCYVMKSYQTSELEKVTWPFDWIWLVSVMSRTDIWLVVKLRVRTNSELLELRLGSLPKNANQVEWPFDQPWRCYVFTEDKCKKDAFQGGKKSKNKETHKKRIKIHPYLVFKILSFILFTFLQWS